jgi:hypothetical protein
VSISVTAAQYVQFEWIYGARYSNVLEQCVMFNVCNSLRSMLKKIKNSMTISIQMGRSALLDLSSIQTSIDASILYCDGNDTRMTIVDIYHCRRWEKGGSYSGTLSQGITTRAPQPNKSHDFGYAQFNWRTSEILANQILL